MATRSHGKRVSDGGDGRNVREDRIKQYSDPLHRSNWDGRSHQDAIDRWSDRASRHSQLADRAAGDPSTNGATKPNLDPPARSQSEAGKVRLHSTSSPPRTRPDVDAKMTDGKPRPRIAD
jgi:hypothetical protein